MANISVTFNYDLPDDYLAQTNKMGKSGTWTYVGPDTIWIHINKETLTLNPGVYKTVDDGGDDYPHPIDCYVVKVDCSQDPLIACLVRAEDGVDYGSLPQYSETLPDGTVYKRPATPPPDHTYEASQVTYNPETGKFVKPYPWKQPHMTWAGIRAWRQGLLTSSDHAIASDVPSTLRNGWKTYRNTLRNLPQDHGGNSSVVRSVDITAASPANTLGQSVIQLTAFSRSATVDTTASGPINTAPQTILQLTSVSSISVGMVISESSNTYFTANTTVVSVDFDDKQVTLSNPILVSIATAITVNFTTSTSISGITVGMHVESGNAQRTLFPSAGTDMITVVAVNTDNNQVTLNYPLLVNITNSIAMTFYSIPTTSPWKIQPPTDPNGKM
jgi:Cu/Ag efflux protein CusF